MKTNHFRLIIFITITLLSTTVNAQWTQIGSDIEGEATDDNSGYSISLSTDGSIVAIGAVGNDGNSSESGHVRVYQYSLSSWTQIGSDIDGEALGDNSGYSISLNADGTILAIGATNNDGNGIGAGHVRVYQDSSNNWIQIGNDIDGEAAGDNSGYSVSLNADGTILAIGATNNDGNGNDAGHVRVYQYSAGNWIKIGSDIDGENAGNYFGVSVDLNADGTILAIGATGNDGNGNSAGHVRVFQDSSNYWIQIGSDIDGENAGDHSGYSVSLNADGTILAVGATGNDGNGNDAGHVRIYQYSSNNWTQTGSDIDGETVGDNSGCAVSLSADGSIVAIGALGNDGNGNDAGQIRVYQYSASNWTQIGSDIDGDVTNDYFGSAVSLSADGSIVAIGAPENDGNGADAGHTKIYTNPSIGIYESNNSLLVQIYPNPTTGKFVIKTEEKMKEIKLLNISGKTMFLYDNFSINNNVVNINIQDLCKGIYFINIKTKTGKYINKKIILQ